MSNTAGSGPSFSTHTSLSLLLTSTASWRACKVGTCRYLPLSPSPYLTAASSPSRQSCLARIIIVPFLFLFLFLYSNNNNPVTEILSESLSPKSRFHVPGAETPYATLVFTVLPPRHILHPFVAAYLPFAVWTLPVGRSCKLGLAAQSSRSSTLVPSNQRSVTHDNAQRYGGQSCPWPLSTSMTLFAHERKLFPFSSLVGKRKKMGCVRACVCVGCVNHCSRPSSRFRMQGPEPPFWSFPLYQRCLRAILI